MLVVDRREIEFDADALLDYLSLSPLEASKIGLPGIRPVDIKFCAAEGKVDIFYGNENQLGAFRMAGEALGILLVSYCLRARIPMPRIADKIIRVESNCVVLTFKTWFTDAPVFDAPESVASAAEALRSWKWFEPGFAA